MKIVAIALVALFAQSSYASFVRTYKCQEATDERTPIVTLKETVAHMVKGDVVEAWASEIKLPARQGHRPTFIGLKQKECKRGENDRTQYTCTWTMSAKVQKAYKLVSYTAVANMNLGGEQRYVDLWANMLTATGFKVRRLPCTLQGR